jgi:multisubunit Na+/H+ antiporter MnhB subunit
MAAGLIIAGTFGLTALVMLALSNEYSWPERSFAMLILAGSAAIGITHEFVSKRKEADAVDEA